MKLLMDAMALLVNAEGIEQSKIMYDIDDDKFLELTEISFNPRYLTSVSPHPSKPGHSFIMVGSEEFTINETREAFKARVEFFMSRNNYMTNG